MHSDNRVLISNASNVVITAFLKFVHTSILSGEMLRLRERYGDLEPERDLEGLLEIYLDPTEI